MRLQGKVAFITGAARGAGEAQARLFAREGSSVLVADLREAQGRAVASDIAASGGRAFFARMDVVNEEDWKRAIDECVTRFGGLDVLVNNAAIFRSTPIVETTEAEWDELMAINAKGVFLGTKHAIRRMRDGGGGSIVNISSTAGLVAGGRGPAYGSSKAAVRLLTKYVAVQHAGDGIRSNSIHPGALDTEMISEKLGTPEGRADVMSKVPLGRIGTVDDVAFAALFLASDESSYVTGSELVVDGGLIAQ